MQKVENESGSPLFSQFWQSLFCLLSHVTAHSRWLKQLPLRRGVVTGTNYRRGHKRCRETKWHHSHANTNPCRSNHTLAVHLAEPSTPLIRRNQRTFSGNYIENLFVHLTAFDSATAEILPEAATAWEISEDRLIYNL